MYVCVSMLSICVLACVRVCVCVYGSVCVLLLCCCKSLAYFDSYAYVLTDSEFDIEFAFLHAFVFLFIINWRAAENCHSP